MKDIEIIKYSNLFPTDVTRGGHLLLCVLYFGCPFHKSSLLLLTRPFMGEAEAITLLKLLSEKGYLNITETGMGKFYSITAKTVSFLDVEKNRKPYRSQKVAERLYLTYYLQSRLIAEHLVLKCLPVMKQDDLLPKNKEKKDEVISAMIWEIRNGTIPFLEGYNSRLYKTIKHPLIQSLCIYEKTAMRISALSAKLNAEKMRATNDANAANRYLSVYNTLCELRRDLEEAKLRGTILTYSHGAKVLTLQNLLLNGIVIQEASADTIVFGLLDNTIGGLSTKKLRERMDYITSFAEHLGMEYTVHLYVAEEYSAISEKTLSKALPRTASKLVCLPVAKSVFSRNQLQKAMHTGGNVEATLKNSFHGNRHI